jgi:lipopolysaccharide export system protein LptA
MTQTPRRLGLLVATIALLAPALAAAQGPHSAAAPAPAPANGSPVQSMIQGGGQDQPVQIEAASLEVRDKSKMATFAGNVQVVQGDTTMKCQKLVVFYGEEIGIAQQAGGNGQQAGTPQLAPKLATGGPKSAQNIRRIEARGGVTVVTKDQNASGDLGVYDLIQKTITLTGNVVVSQGQSVIHGERVVVDTVTGNARVEASNQGSGATPSRVRALIQPNGQGGGNMMTIGPGAAPAAGPAAPGRPTER